MKGTELTYLGGSSVPAEVLRVGVEAQVVGLALGPRGAQRQTVTVPLDFFHLQHTTHRACPALSNKEYAHMYIYIYTTTV